MRSLMAAPRIGNAASALNRLRLTELESRRQAKTILSPEEMTGRLSPARLLSTTLGGKLRQITPADLAQFRSNVANLGARARQGLTPSEALAMSDPPDIARARQEITFSMPARLQNGRVHLVTNAGPESRVTRHHVVIEFGAYSAALAMPGTPSQVAKWLCTDSPVRWSCDCERWRYVFRYLASAGGWNEGRAETGYPKIRNPNLIGCLCKHGLRVAVDLAHSIGLRQRVAAMIEADRARINRPGSKAKPKVLTVRQVDAERMLPKTARRIVAPGSARAVAPPKAASRSDIEAALKAYAGRKDANSAAITRALSALLAQPGGSR
jgi:hypothetical protein